MIQKRLSQRSKWKYAQYVLLVQIVALALINYLLVYFLPTNEKEWLVSPHAFKSELKNLSYENQTTLVPKESKKQVGIGSKQFQSIAQRHEMSEDCHKVVSDAALDEWKSDSRVVCLLNSTLGSSSDAVLIQEYVLRSWEYEPTFVRYRNVEGYWAGDIMPLPCPGVTLRHEKDGVIKHIKPSWAVDNDLISEKLRWQRNESTIVEIKETVFRVSMFDQHNTYERFHAYLNVAMIMRMFDIVNPRVVLMLDTGSMTDNTLDMWRTISNMEPIVVDTRKPHSQMTGEQLKRFHDLIDATWLRGTSMLVTKSRALKGRGTDHHCKSTLYRDIAHWMMTNLGIEQDLNVRNVTNILWSSRKPYCCVDNKTWMVKRSMSDEDRFLQVLAGVLGPQYHITAIDFGRVTVRESIENVSQSDILMGVHGAGLIWAGFLPIHGGLIELFGGDRGRFNRHYHNVASLADLHYRELTLDGSDPINWNDGTVKELVKLIQSIELKHMSIEPS